MIKKFLLLSVLISLLSIYGMEEVNAQGFGVSMGMGTSNTLTLYGDLFYLDGQNSYHFGGTFQSSDAFGTRIKESELEINDGIRNIGSGNYFWSIDFGYNYHFKNKMTFGGELSLGEKNEYTNYTDYRSSEGVFHMVESKLTGGIGLNAGYHYSNTTFGFIGYNTLRALTFGVRFTLQ